MVCFTIPRLWFCDHPHVEICFQFGKQSDNLRCDLEGCANRYRKSNRRQGWGSQQLVIDLPIATDATGPCLPLIAEQCQAVNPRLDGRTRHTFSLRHGPKTLV